MFAYNNKLFSQRRQLPYKGFGKQKNMLSQHILFSIKRYVAMINDFKYSKVEE